MSKHSTPLFGALLKRYRTARLLTQEQLASRATLSPDTIRALESGKRRVPRSASLHLLIAALDLNDDDRDALLTAASRDSPNAISDGDVVSRAGFDLSANQPGPLIGRDDDLQAIQAYLTMGRDQEDDRTRLLTLTGPHGVGKTRLAMAAASRLTGMFPDGVVPIDLAPLRDPILVLPTVARRLGIADIGSRPLAERVVDALRPRTMLLLLDNFEHLLPAAAALADLIARCPGLTLLVTSRIPLRLRWERTLRVAPLATPDLTGPLPAIETLEAIPAVSLFLDLARRRRPNFVLDAAQALLVARLTSELDGLPLALELAAARLETLPLPLLATRLSDRLRLLRWDALDLPERQRSVEAAVGWSYDLLDVDEQRLFRCLGVFAGQVSLPAITTVFAAVTTGEQRDDHERPRQPGSGAPDSGRAVGRTLELLASLAEKSLIIPIGERSLEPLPGETDTASSTDVAFRVLETVREYAWTRLDASGELVSAQRAHARYFLRLSEEGSDQLRGHEQRRWFLRLEHEHDNLRAALRWYVDSGPPEVADGDDAHIMALRMVSALSYFWWTRGYLVEGWRWIDEALRGTSRGEHAIRLRALIGASAILAYQGSFDLATSVLREAFALAQLNGQRAELAQVYAFTGMCSVYSGDVEHGTPWLRKALAPARALGDHHLVGLILMYLGGAAFAQRRLRQAESSFTESLASFEQAGDGRFAGNLQVNLSWFDARRGNLPSAIRRLRIGLDAGVTFEERRLISVALQMAMALPGALAANENASHQGRRARLLGAADAISEATGLTLLQRILAGRMDRMREMLLSGDRVDLQTQYTLGRSLSLASVAEEARLFLQDLENSHVADNVIDETAPAQSPNSNPRVGQLSLRQRDILRLVAQGLSNKAIAQRLNLSAATVAYHLHAAFTQLHVVTRAQAVSVATQRGMV